LEKSEDQHLQYWPKPSLYTPCGDFFMKKNVLTRVTLLCIDSMKIPAPPT
jgi:hypothetical protein